MARSSRPLTRRMGTATEVETVAIVCEGQKTEGIYFNGIRAEFRLATAVIQVVGLGADPLTVVKKAEEFKSSFDHVWAVFDVEASGPHSQRHASLEAAVARADRLGIRCAICHPCFELWLILHFKLHAGYLSNKDAHVMVSGLDCDYSDKQFDFAKVWPLHESAVKNADQLDRQKRLDHPRVVDRNPWTSVHKLVTQLVAIAGAAASGIGAPVRRYEPVNQARLTSQDRGHHQRGR